MQKKSKKLGLSCLIALLITLVLSGCFSQSQPADANVKTVGDNNTMLSTVGTEYNVEVYSSDYVSIVCKAIYTDRIEFDVTSKLSNNQISVYLETVSLDGLVPDVYYSDTCWPELAPQQTVTATYNAYINYTSHKYMSACFEVFNDEGRGVENIDIVNFDLGEEENIEYKEPDGVLMYDSASLGITYAGADDTGIRLRLNNKLGEATTIAFDTVFYINGEEIEDSLSADSIPAYSVMDYYIYAKKYNPDYIPDEIDSFRCSGYTSNNLDNFDISSDIEVCALANSANISSSNDSSNSQYKSTYSEAATDVSNISMGERNALDKAVQYLSVMAFSYSGLVEQLEYEGYTLSEATYAVDNCGADWNEQAAKKAQEYLDVMSFSRVSLIEQLEYEGFTRSQAEYGVSAVGY